MSDPAKEAREDVEAVAALVGTVNAQLGQIDEQIISTSTNLQHSKDNWNPKQVLKDEIKAAGAGGEGALMAPPPPSQPVQVQQPVMQQPVMQQPQAFITDPQILERLDKIEEALSSLCLTDEKIMKSLLKNNTKQITIRFDDSKSSK